MKINKLQQRFRRFGLLSIVSIYLLILAGGIVRSTGSGMGCPDWPKCFGSWVPPTSESQLPEDYQQVFKEKRHKKNEKLAKYLSLLSFKSLAQDVLNEETDPVNLRFNVQKTYIEYLNRVVGVITGFFIFMTFLYSFSFLKETWSFTLLSFFNLLLVGLQGWIGSLVVSTDLLPWMVTIHMLLTVVILALILFLVYKASLSQNLILTKDPTIIKILLWASIVVSMIQMIWGTQVREMIDQIAVTFAHAQRELWIERLGIDFVIHRSFSWLVLAINVVLVYLVYKRFKENKVFTNLVNALFVCVIIEIIAGVVLAYFSIPAFLQPIHLLFAFVILGIQFLFLFIINFRKSPDYLTV